MEAFRPYVDRLEMLVREFRAERGFWGGLVWKLHMYGQILRAWYISTHDHYPEEKAFSSDISKF